MKKYALLFDYRYCTGCQSCEVACKNEKGLSADDEPWGIKTVKFGPWELEDGSWEYDVFALPTQICDVCEERIEQGKKPACVHHCLARCIDFGTIEELAPKMAAKGGKALLVQP